MYIDYNQEWINEAKSILFLYFSFIIFFAMGSVYFIIVSGWILFQT